MIPGWEYPLVKAGLRIMSEAPVFKPGLGLRKEWAEGLLEKLDAPPPPVLPPLGIENLEVNINNTYVHSEFDGIYRKLPRGASK